MWLGEIRHASHNFSYYHSCLSCADAKKILPALTLSLLLQWVDQTRWWAGLLPGSAGSPSKAYGACACPGESTAQNFIWGLGPNSSPLEGLEGWACAAHCPSWDHLCGVVLRGALFLDRWRATGHPWKSQAPCFGAAVGVTLCLILTPPARPAGGHSCECGPQHPGAPQSQLCCKNKSAAALT